MKKYLKEIIIIIILLILLFSICLLIYVKQNKQYELFDTRWNMYLIEKITDNTTSIITKYEKITINFLENMVCICAYYENGNTCSINNYIKSKNIYVINKDELLDIYGTVSYEENGNIKLEQIQDDGSKIIYYFEKES